MGYDMIPEVMGYELKDEMWKEKRRAIEHASAHVMISANSARDLERIMPMVPQGSTIVAHCGVAAALRPSAEEEIRKFKRRYNLSKPYVLTVGDRVGFGGYKNAFLLFRAVSLLSDPTHFALVCVGGHNEIEPSLRALVPATDVRRLKLDDDELTAAYSGAHAYVCTSRYEGFGMPIIEAMVCQCPVVACRNSSIPEVAGEAALFVGEDDAKGLAEALLLLKDQKLRGDYIKRGVSQASRFSFSETAEEIARAVLNTVEGLKSGSRKMPSPAWHELRMLQQEYALTLEKSMRERADRLRAEHKVLRAERDSLRAERDSLADERDGLRAERDSLAAVRDALLGSTSWRLTAPIRALRKLFR
jgi:glycosyltransferase involved in cell wall biosynthesis